MKKRQILALILTAVMALSGVFGSAYADPIDTDNAFAGASEALASFFEGKEDAKERIMLALQEIRSTHAEAGEDGSAPQVVKESKDDHITEYEEPKLAVVSAEVMLNVRSRPTASGDLVGQLGRGSEADVIGEAQINGNLWYHVQMEDSTGYVAGTYLLFGDEASEFVKNLDEVTTWAFAPEMPESFALQDDISGLDEETAAKLNGYVEQINYCLKSDYPAQKEANSYMGMYSILLYIIENFTHLQEICYEYDLTNTYEAAGEALTMVENNRVYICEGTKQSDDEIVDEILQAQAEKAAEEARIAQEKAEEEARQAAEKAEQERIAAEQAIANKRTQIANYAASFIGVLPYVWGGASLKSGADCSGFVAQIMAHFGLIDQSVANCHGLDSSALRNVGYAVDISQIQPGDIVCYNGHVAIYYGNGVVVHEPSPGKMCSWGDLHMAPIITIRRLT